MLSKCLSVGVAEAATAYVRHRDEQAATQKARLEFVAEAGQLLASSLDYRSTLTRLTGLLVPGMADWCAIHLDGVPYSEMPMAHVDPAKGAMLRELYTRFPPTVASEQGHLQVLKTGEPQLASRIEPGHFDSLAQNDEHRALIRAIDSCSFIIVPLRVQENVFGTMMLAYSDSRRHYDESDLVLANDLARRAAAAIDNARLYALSQKERSRVEAATRAKDEFVAMVSHELRTPLNAILGWLRLVRSGTLDDSSLTRGLGIIERNAEAQSRSSRTCST